MTYHEIMTEANSEASDWLLHATARRASYADEQAGYVFHSASKVDGGRRAGISRPTENRAERLASLKASKRWLSVIDEVEGMLSQRKLQLLYLRRKAEADKNDGDVGRPDWVPQVLHRMQDASHQAMSERTLYAWWASMIELTVRVAIRRGCL